MTISSALSSVEGNIVIFFVIALLAFAAILFYALYKKGDVRAELSNGRMVFKLDVKEKKLG